MSHSNLRIAIRSVVAALAMLVLSATAVFAEDGNILEPQHGIPLVVINIDESEEAIAAAEANDDKHDYGTIAEMNESEKHSVRCVGTVEIKVPDDYDLPGSDTSWVEKSLKLDYIRGRGNSTWSDVSKRPYKFKLSNKADLFGMGKSKEWALMANYYDDSIIHNRITYWLGKQIGMPYNMEGVPVDVVMQGAGDPVYLGCYDLSELVEVDASRVAIEKDGGYIPIRGGRTTYDDQEVYAELKVDTDGSFTKKTVYTHPSGLVEGRDRITILYNKNNPDDYIIKGENNDDPLVAYVFLALELLIVPMLIAAMRATIKERKEFREKYHISGKE